jgi:hypothetical protein
MISQDYQSFYESDRRGGLGRKICRKAPSLVRATNGGKGRRNT